MNRFLKTTKQLLKDYNISPLKRFGQNFLINDDTSKRIVDLAKLNKDNIVIEIGSGLGALTKFIVDKVEQLICYEIDKTLCNILENLFKDKQNIQINCDDILNVDLNALFSSFDKKKRVVIISNLPYYITSDIIIKILTLTKHPDVFIAMTQKEVAKRITSSLDGKDLNELSLYSNIFSKPTYEFCVSRNDFHPKPKVDSAIISYSDFSFKHEDEGFLPLIKALLKQRRKTIYNNLSSLGLNDTIISSTLENLNIKKDTRAENLEFDDFRKIYLELKPYLD